MLHVVIDSSTYKEQHYGKSQAFKILLKLCQDQKVRLHIPYMVQEEILSQRINASQKSFNSIIKEIERLRGNNFVTPHALTMLDAYSEKSQELRSHYTANVELFCHNIVDKHLQNRLSFPRLDR